MKVPGLIAGLVCAQLLAGCTYESVRASERRRCAAMPQSQAELCYRRTAVTAAEYEARREELRRSVEGSVEGPEEEARDPRFEKWVP
jgi:hypothetical protein